MQNQSTMPQSGTQQMPGAPGTMGSQTSAPQPLSQVNDASSKLASASVRDATSQSLGQVQSVQTANGKPSGVKVFTYDHGRFAQKSYRSGQSALRPEHQQSGHHPELFSDQFTTRCAEAIDDQKELGGQQAKEKQQAVRRDKTSPKQWPGQT